MDLEDLRKQIDAIDEQIIQLIGERLQVVDQVGAYKQLHGIDVRDTSRFQALLKKLRTQAHSHDIPADLVEKIYHEIHETAIARQRDSKLQ